MAANSSDCASLREKWYHAGFPKQWPLELVSYDPQRGNSRSHPAMNCPLRQSVSLRTHSKQQSFILNRVSRAICLVMSKVGMLRERRRNMTATTDDRVVALRGAQPDPPDGARDFTAQKRPRPSHALPELRGGHEHRLCLAACVSNVRRSQCRDRQIGSRVAGRIRSHEHVHALSMLQLSPGPTFRWSGVRADGSP